MYERGGEERERSLGEKRVLREWGGAWWEGAEEGIRSPGDEIARSCELPSMNAGN